MQHPSPTGCLLHEMQPASPKHLRVKMVSSALPKSSSLSLSDSDMTSHITALSKPPLQHPLFGKVAHRNGIISPNHSPSPSVLNSKPNHVSSKLVSPKTEGRATSEQSSLTNTASERARLVCPELAMGYTSSILGNRSGQLVSRQQDLAKRLASLRKSLHEKQLAVAHNHAKNQLASLREGRRRSPLSWSRDSSTSTLSTTSSEEHKGRVPPKIDMQVDGTMAEPPLPKRPHVDIVEPERDHVDIVEPKRDHVDIGEPERDPMFQESSVDEAMDISLPLSSDSFLSLSDWTEEDLVSAATRIQQQLGNLESLVDDELTDFSSDEEVEGKNTKMRPLASIKNEWERDHASLGSRWAWLERRITELNSEICQLSGKLQHRPSRERFLLAPPTPSPPSVYQLPNGALMEQLQKGGGGNGSLLAAAVLGKGGRGTNGVNHHPPASFPQLLITEGPLGARLQVKDLLTPSPLGRNFPIILNEAGCTSARTRPLQRRARRKVVRLRKGREGVRTRGKRVDSSYHPQLSLAKELPSRVWLDRAVHRIAQEHSYSCLPLPLSKRRRAASSLPPVRNISRPPSRFDRSSATPSPINTSGSLDKDRAKVPRRKLLVQLDSHPASPGLPSPATPLAMTPHQRSGRKRPPTSTPSYDIDNIVIPYSMACSARLEKLEYKEILTPSWREVGPAVVNGNDSAAEKPLSNHCSEEEDVSDEVFGQRHEKCELGEKKRFMNFITGSQKKRARPQSLASTPDGSQVGSPHPPPASQGKLQKGLVSPASLDGEYWQPQVLPWSPRPFPLSDKDMELLHNPVPPPRAVRPSPSPSPMLTRPYTPTGSPALKFHTPLGSCSTPATPLSSPSTPYDELPLLSPSEWMVINNSSLSCPSRHPPADVSSSSGSSSESHSQTGIILKLSKRT